MKVPAFNGPLKGLFILRSAQWGRMSRLNRTSSFILIPAGKKSSKARKAREQRKQARTRRMCWRPVRPVSKKREAGCPLISFLVKNNNKNNVSLIPRERVTVFRFSLVKSNFVDRVVASLFYKIIQSSLVLGNRGSSAGPSSFPRLIVFIYPSLVSQCPAQKVKKRFKALKKVFFFAHWICPTPPLPIRL